MERIKPIPRLGLVGLLTLLSLASAEAEADRLLPDLRALPPYDLEVRGSREDGDLELRFSVMFWNAGPSALELRGDPDPDAETARAYQYFYTENDVVPGEYVGEFYWDAEHEHVHLDNFAQYEIWTLTEDDALDELVLSNPKVAFCLIDHSPIEPERIDEEETPRYTECQYEVQGISSGWGDEYHASLSGQQLDISHLEDGAYALVVTVDPDGLLEEHDETNNTATEFFALEEGALTPYPRE